MTLKLTDTERAYVAAAIRGEVDEAARLERLVEAEQAAREERLNTPTALRDAALWYAGAGLAVFPCLPGQKKPATTHGFQDATTDPEQITRWWKVRPDYNIATPTGLAFDVVDVDSPSGLLALGDLLDGDPDAGDGDIYTQLEAIGLAFTPRGRHYYVPPDPDVSNGTRLVDDVDYRAAGGYVVIPPSRTPTGAYRWSQPLSPTLGAA